MHENSLPDCPAWLEDASGSRIVIQGTCSFGRSASNQVVLPDEKVSRRHAVLQRQGEDEFWLVDFGSRNGTSVNGRRISHPTQLREGDQLGIGPFLFVFHQANQSGGLASATASTERTVTEIRSAVCWLLVADIVDSTRLVRRLAPDEFPVVTGQWLADCKLTIEECGGQINQFLGDGFFAYWLECERVEVVVHKALQALRRMQETERPIFRVVIHRGTVVFGGVGLREEERISGPEVHFVFRMEKLAGTLGHSRLMSEPAWERLAALVEANDAGSHPLSGMDAKFKFFSF